jgi:hypothetical protein
MKKMKSSLSLSLSPPPTPPPPLFLSLSPLWSHALSARASLYLIRLLEYLLIVKLLEYLLIVKLQSAILTGENKFNKGSRETGLVAYRANN